MITKPTQLELELAIVMIRAAREYKQDKKREEIIPEEGTKKFYILNNRARCYTIIGADNKHHVANKATRLYGTKWDGCWFNKPEGYDFLSVKQFGALLKALP